MMLKGGGATTSTTTPVPGAGGGGGGVPSDPNMGGTFPGGTNETTISYKVRETQPTGIGAPLVLSPIAQIVAIVLVTSCYLSDT